HTRRAVRRLTGVLVAMAVGAFVGDWLLSHAHTYAPVLPVLVIALVIATASVAFKHEPARSPCRPRVGRRLSLEWARAARRRGTTSPSCPASDAS
ncbi:MAG: hypothetical protein JWR58_3471, partial [Pseudonocardia sp.]|nr:hypothetical protein [Pseudonocardia sp.]